ncbi:MAG: AMP-binding protein [Kiritimatiellia bacterium]
MIFEAFKKMREDRPSAAAFLVTCGDLAWPITWKRFTDDIDIVAHLIRTYAPGAKVGILGENSYEWMVAHAAVLFSGAVAIPVDINLTPQEISERMKFTGAVALVHSSLYEDKAREAGKLTPGLIVAGFGTIKTERFLDKLRGVFGLKGSLWRRDSLDLAEDSTGEPQTSMIVFTSGTTSTPQGVELTVRSLETFCEWAVACLPMRPGDRSLMILPLHHIFGICVTYLMLARGVALGVCPDFRRIYDAFVRFRANFAFLVPALAEILAQKIQQRGDSAEAAIGQPIDWIVTGGAALPRRAYEHLTALGVKTITAYGLTETCAAYSITPLAGDPHVGAQGHVSQARGVKTMVSPAGELLIKGPCVMKGYYRRPDKTAQAIDASGWYHTGDVGRIDEDGFVWITGRASRTIVLSSGKKIAPEELEEKLMFLPGVREAVVSGEGESREIRAEIYALISEEQVRKSVAALNLTLPVYKRIKTVIVRREPFPRTASGKIKV